MTQNCVGIIIKQSVFFVFSKNVEVNTGNIFLMFVSSLFYESAVLVFLFSLLLGSG